MVKSALVINLAERLELALGPFLAFFEFFDTFKHTFAAIAQLVRALACHARGWRFEPAWPRRVSRGPLPM